MGTDGQLYFISYLWQHYPEYVIKECKKTIVSTNINDLYQKAKTTDVHAAIPRFPQRQNL